MAWLATTTAAGTDASCSADLVHLGRHGHGPLALLGSQPGERIVIGFVHQLVRPSRRRRFAIHGMFTAGRPKTHFIRSDVLSE